MEGKIPMKTIVKKALSLFLVSAFLFSYFPLINSAMAQELWDGTSSSTFSGGDGTQNAPYKITNAAQLNFAVCNSYYDSNFSNAYYELENDIYLNNDSIFAKNEANQVIGVKDNSEAKLWRSYRFAGIFDGNNHTIYGAYCEPSYSGENMSFFGNLRQGAIVKNLSIGTGYIRGSYAAGFCHTVLEDAQICNCTNNATIASSSYGGGIAATNYGTITNCANYGYLTTSTESEIGGVENAGIVFYNSGLVLQCTNYSDIEAYGSIGGIVGGSNGIVAQCVNYGNISASGGSGGGIADSGYLISCINYGNVSTTYYLGANQRLYSGSVGGIAGVGDIINCINYGTVSSGVPENAGALVGEAGEVSGCISYNNDDIDICATAESNSINNCWYTSATESRFDGAIHITNEDTLTSEFLYEFNSFVSNNTVPYMSYWRIGNNELTFATNDDLHEITAESSEGGTITPSGTQKILAGFGCTYQMNAEYGYVLSDVIVDGKSVGAVSSYAFSNVTASHSIKAIFSTDGTFSDSFAGGSGSADDPYTIETKEQLKYLAHQVQMGEHYENTYFLLTEDIALNSKECFEYDSNGIVSGINTENMPTEWRPIGYHGDSFRGHFNGGNHTISGLYVNTQSTDSEYYTGLFGYTLGASIANLNLGYGYVSGGWNVGGIASYCDTMINCHNQNTRILGTKSYIGGIVGWGKLIKDSSNYAPVSGYTDVAGIAGSCDIVFGCNNYGEIYASYCSGGGIAGACGVSPNSSICESNNYGNISGGKYLGGIAGDTATAMTICGCFNFGEISGAYAGGFVGEVYGEISLINCCNLGNVPNGYTDYGILMDNQTVQETNTYYLDTVSVISTRKAKPISAQELRSAAIASDFNQSLPEDIDGLHYWTIDSTTGYPVLSDEADVYRISVNCFGGGTIEPRSRLLLTRGSCVDLKFVPDTGNKVSSIIINGQNESATTEYSINSLDKDYIIQLTFCNNQGEIITGFESGIGTSTDPFIIADENDLKTIAANVNCGNTDYSGYHFAFSQDIELNAQDTFLYQDGYPYSAKESAEVWQPIGTSGIEFQGNIDGRNHSISGLYINQNSDSCGLFGYLGQDSVIKNLSITNSLIYSNSAYYGLIAGTNAGAIKNCQSENSSVGRSGAMYVGGIVGNNLGNITDCSNATDVIGTIYVGGITGVNNALVSNCKNVANLSNGQRVGGIVGLNHGDVTDCKNSGNICPLSWCIGGIVGESRYEQSDAPYEEARHITGCINTGAIKAYTYAGGITGGADDTLVSGCYNYGTVSCTDYCAGGIAADCYSWGEIEYHFAISACVNYGDVYSLNEDDSPNTNTGGIVGSCNTKVRNCINYGKINVSGRNGRCAGCGGVIGSTSNQVYNCANYGEINSVGENVGGVIGTTQDSAYNCYNRGKITGGTNVGGVAGSSNYYLFNCYNAGTITGTINAGEIAGNNGLTAQINNCYYVRDSGLPCIGIDNSHFTSNGRIIPMCDLLSVLNCSVEDYGSPYLLSWILDSEGYPVHNGTVVAIGDLNSDGMISVTDMQALYDYLSKGLLPNAGVTYCDINGDSDVNILDYQALYELIKKLA